MTSQDAPTTDLLTPDLTAAFALVRNTAAEVLNDHTNEAGLCAVCGSAWPCERAVLAEHNLAAL